MREVVHDGRGSFRIRFRYDRALVDLVKTLPDRRWNPAEKFWSVPEAAVVEMVELLEPHGFTFDEATREIYRSHGGTLTLDAAAPAGPALPGLFDEPGTNGLPGDYTVHSLNERVRDVLDGAFPAPVWLVGEISGFNKNAHKRHVTFQLEERDPSGKVLSSVGATLFESTRRRVEEKLAAVGEPFRLEDEISVRVFVRVELYVPWGSYRVVVQDLDVAYTLGEAARRREEILRKLAEAGLLERNRSLPLPSLPLRVGLITSLNSDAYNDVLRTLNESGYAFRVVAHGARVQGRSTEPSVLNALDRLAEIGEELDVVLICRGGGSRTDLAWFDSEALGRAVARFPLPVVVGIGHEQDRSVLDDVARRAKTPTAAAQFLVQRVAETERLVEENGRAILRKAERAIHEEQSAARERAARLGRAAGALLERESAELRHRRVRTARAARGLLGQAARDLSARAAAVPRAAGVLLAERRARLEAATRQVAQGARRDLGEAGRFVAAMVGRLAPGALRAVALETERSDGRARRLHLLDPRRVVERGYSILRRDGGRVVTDAADAPAGEHLRADLRRGALRLLSEGPESAPGGEGA